MESKTINNKRPYAAIEEDEKRDAPKKVLRTLSFKKVTVLRAVESLNIEKIIMKFNRQPALTRARQHPELSDCIIVENNTVNDDGTPEPIAIKYLTNEFEIVSPSEIKIGSARDWEGLVKGGLKSAIEKGGATARIIIQFVYDMAVKCKNDSENCYVFLSTILLRKYGLSDNSLMHFAESLKDIEVKFPDVIIINHRNMACYLGVTEINRKRIVNPIQVPGQYNQSSFTKGLIIPATKLAAVIVTLKLGIPSELTRYLSEFILNIVNDKQAHIKAAANPFAELKVANEINTANLTTAAEKNCPEACKENVDITTTEVQKYKTALEEAEKERDEIKAEMESELEKLKKEKETIMQQLKEGNKLSKEKELLNIRLEEIKDEYEMKIIQAEMEGKKKLYDQKRATIMAKNEYETALAVSATLGDTDNRGIALISKVSVANQEHDIIKYNATELNKTLKKNWQTGMKNIMGVVRNRVDKVLQYTGFKPVCILVGGNNMLNGRGDLEKEFETHGAFPCREYKLTNNDMDDIYEKVKRCFNGKVACAIKWNGEIAVLSEMKMASLSEERSLEIKRLITRMENGNL